MKITVKQAFERAVRAHQSGNLDEAKLTYQAILKVQPDLAEANYNLAILNITQGHLTYAIQLFQKASQAEPGSYEYLSSLIKALLKNHQFDLAHETLLKSECAELLKSQITSLELQIEAEKEKHDALVLKIPPQKTLDELLKVYQEGRFDLAENLGRELTLEYPMHPLGWHVVGIVLMEACQPLDAIEFIAKSAALSPEDPQAQNNLGIVLRDLGDLQGAQRCYEKAIEIDPEYAEAFNNLGALLYMLGKLLPAKTMYEKAISLQSGNAAFHCNLGNALKGSGELLKAKASYQQAIYLDPLLHEAFLNLAKMPIKFLDKKIVGILENASIFHECANLDASTHHFFRANVLKHKGNLKLSFDEFCKANDLKWKSTREQAYIEHLEQIEYLDIIRKWKPKTQVFSKGTLAKLIIAGPSRSGKSLLEKFIGEISDTHLLYETFREGYATEKENNDEINDHKLFKHLFLENEVDLFNQGYKAVTVTNPGHIFHADYLLDNLKNSYVLIISRDTRDNISEIFTTDYTKGNEYSYSYSAISRYIKTYYEICDEIYKKVPDRCIRIRFEDLVENPKATLSNLNIILQSVLELDCELIPKLEIDPKSIFREYISRFDT